MERRWRHATGTSAAVLVLIGTAEAVIMISPFAGYFYAAFRPFLNLISDHEATAWLGGFFLNHALVTSSPILEGQRLVGKYLFALAIWGFGIAFLQVYVGKIFRRPGVVRVGLYRFVRHPQYLCLILAAWGLLTYWPRILLLCLFVTIVFTYVLLARIEEARMEERFPREYRAYRRGRGGFLPGSPGERLYATTFGRIPNRAAGFVLCYLVCLSAAIAGAFATRSWVKGSTSWTAIPERRTVALSVWPRSEGEMRSIMERVYEVPAVRSRIEADGGPNFVAHILPADYGMVGMYAVLPGELWEPPVHRRIGEAGRLALRYLLPREPGTTGPALMGRPTDRLNVVISRSGKPYRPEMPFEECIDPGVKLRPVIIVQLHARRRIPGLPRYRLPLRRNRWGDISMPIF